MNNWKEQFVYTKWYYLFGYSVPILFLVSLISNNEQLFLITFFFLSLFLINYVYLIYSSKNVSIEGEKIIRKLFPGEETTLEIPFINNGRFPIIYMKGNIHIRRFDNAITLPNIKDDIEETLHYNSYFSIHSETKKTMKLQIKSLKRGSGEISAIQIEMYDLLQIFHVKMQYIGPYRGEVVVYPSPIDIVPLQQFVQRERGDFFQSFSLYEDVMQIRGNREYVSSDPFNRIHWKASARMNELQTKEYEKINVSKWTIIVNIQEDKDGFHFIPTIHDLEHVLSQVTSACYIATERNIYFEIYINIKIPNSHYGIYLPFSNGKEHLKKALELLARIRKASFTSPIEKTIQTVTSRNDGETTILHFGPYDEDVIRTYEGVKKKGGNVIFIPRKKTKDSLIHEERKEGSS